MSDNAARYGRAQTVYKHGYFGESLWTWYLMTITYPYWDASAFRRGTSSLDCTQVVGFQAHADIRSFVNVVSKTFH
jgi:hypothetical protein